MATSVVMTVFDNNFCLHKVKNAFENKINLRCVNTHFVPQSKHRE